MNKYSGYLWLCMLTCVVVVAMMFRLSPSPSLLAAAQEAAEKSDSPAAAPPITAEPDAAVPTTSDAGQVPPDAAPTGSPQAAPAVQEPDVEIPFRSRPYRVQVSIAFDNECINSRTSRDQLVRSVEEALARMYGRMWTAEVETTTWLVPGQQQRLERLQLSDVFDRYPEEQCDKAFVLTVETSGSAFTISSREYDPRIQELTPVYSRQTLDPRSIGSVAATVMRDAFRPVFVYLRQFDDEEGRSLMELQAQAGEIMPPDPSAEQVREGDVLRPFVRSMERRDPNKLKQLKALPLSYIRTLSVDREVSRGMITGYYATHMRFSMFGGKGRRLQHLAVRQRPTAGKSRVKLVLQSRPDKPLISHRLSIAYQLGWKDPEDGPQTQLVSDRNGDVLIETRENHPTFWIRVYSGASLLARVPYAPGLLPYDVVALPDDSIRLGVEGELQLLQDKLIDAIAMQGVLLARARKAAKANDAEAVEALLDEYAAVPAKTWFLEAISNIRIPAVQEAERRGMGSFRIDKLCAKLADSIGTFFTDEKRAARQAEIGQIQAAVGR